MRQHQALLIAITLVCVVVLGCALYLQLVENMLPCPLCVTQRYAFAVAGLISLIMLSLPIVAQRIAAVIGALSALAGACVAIDHLSVLAHPDVACGADPLKVTLNNLFTAKLMPVLFKSSGFCETPYPPIFGLSIPAWSLLWLSVLLVAFITIAARSPAQRRFFGR